MLTAVHHDTRSGTRRLAARTFCLALVLVATGALTSCSGDSADPAPPEQPRTGLQQALDRIASTPSTSTYVEYGDLAALRSRAGDPQRTRLVRTYGWQSLAEAGPGLAARLGVDPGTFDRAVETGQPADAAGLLLGRYDVAAVEGKLAGLTVPAQQGDGRTTWTAGTDRQADPAGPLAGIARSAELNKLGTGGDSFAHATSAEGLTAVTTPGEQTLADNPVLGRLAECLGDVQAARLTAPAEQSYPQAAGVRLAGGGAGGDGAVGNGVTGNSATGDGAAGDSATGDSATGDSATGDGGTGNSATGDSAGDSEVFCVVASDEQRAAEMKTAADRALREGATPAGTRWADLLAGGTTEILGEDRSMLRITARPVGPSLGVLGDALGRREVESLIIPD